LTSFLARLQRKGGFERLREHFMDAALLKTVGQIAGIGGLALGIRCVER
jgi:hypothetical protein